MVGEGRGGFEGLLFHDVLEAIQGIGDAAVCTLHFVHVGVDGLRPLLAHQTRPNMVPLKPWNAVVLQNMHLGKHTGRGKLPAIEAEELPNVCLCLDRSYMSKKVSQFNIIVPSLVISSSL